MNKLQVLLCLLAISSGAFSQEPQKERYVRKGLFRSMATISTGAMFQQGVTNIYLHGTSEYYVADNVSIRGDGFYYVNTMGDIKPFDFHHAVTAGASYHFKTKGHFDPYLGMAPGVSISSLNPYYFIICDPGPCLFEDIYADDVRVNPIATFHAGFNLYFQRWFHLFMETRYIAGRHYSDYYPEPLGELRFSFGLGWNLNFIKKG